jgi:DNA ligase-1
VRGPARARPPHRGRLGALLVETAEGQRFRIGSGFTDRQREDPPPVGSWITYRFRGQHDSGLPRFATYLRTRADMDLNGPSATPR